MFFMRLSRILIISCPYLPALSLAACGIVEVVDLVHQEDVPTAFSIISFVLGAV